jgi:transposase InsO family protein
MAIHMAQTIREERVRWVLPIAEGRVRLVDLEKICPHSKRSLERWLSAYKKGGEKALEPKATIPKTSPEETQIWIKEKVVAKRKRTKLCAQKTHWKLKKEGLVVPTRTIGKILKQEGLTRKYRVKKIKYKYIKAERQPGELVEIDVKYVPGKLSDRRYFQYTAIDVASRWRHLEIFSEQTNHHAIAFLKIVIERFAHRVQAIKTDNHAIFTNRYNGSYKREDLSPRQLHALDTFCAKNNIAHYLIDPGKPAQNGTVERSHREDQEKFYESNTFRNLNDLKKKLRLWNTYYNDLEHCGLNGKTPNEFLKDYQLIKPPNVLA